ncbi:CPBP family intramembrane glutamic endopeptidase, partial [Enterococcus casseliflavus]
MKRMIFTIIQGIGMAMVLSLLSMWIGEQFFSTYFPRLPEARHGISISSATFSIVLAPIIEEYLIRVKLLPFLI